MIRMQEPMRGHASLGGVSTDVAASAQLRAPIPFPSGSIPRRAPLESAKLSEAALDYFKLVGVLTFITVTGLSIAAGSFILLFVKT